MAGRIQGITVEIGGDTTRLSKALQGVNKDIKSTQSQLKDVEKLLKLDPSNTELLSQKQKLLTQAISETKEKLATLKTAAEQANEQLQKGEITQEQYDALQREIQETEQQLKQLETQASSTNATLAKIEEVGGKFEEVGGKITSVGSTLTKTVTAPIVGLGTAAVKTAADFDEGMSKVSAISGATGDDLDALRTKAREMGAKTKFSATEAASAFEYMAMAGWKTGDMVSGIDGIMSLAAASGEDLATTSDIVTDALTAFGLKAEDSGHFADILAAASSNANTNVSMMGETFKYCAPIAGALGFSAEDTAEAIGLMANSGIKGSQAGTALRTIMNNLTGEVKLSGKALGDVTIQTTNADGSMRDLSDILSDCRGAFAQMTESEKANAAEALVGKNAMSGFLALMNAAPEDIDKLSGAIDSCSDTFVKTKDGAIIPMSEALEKGIEWVEEYNGVSEKMAATMQDNLKGQLTILKSQLEELAISFGELLMPAIRAVVSKVQAFVDKLNGMSEAQKKTILKVAALAAAIGPLQVVLGTVVTKVGTAMKGFAKFGKGILKVTSFVKKSGGVFNALKVALGGVSGTVLAVVAVIAVLVAAFVNLWKNNEEFRNKVTAIWEGLKAKFKAFSDGIVQRLNALGFFFKDITEVIKAVWNKFCEVLAPVFEGAFQVISTVLGTVLDVLLGLFDVFSNLFQGNWSGAWEAVKGVFSSIWEGIKSIFSTVLDTLKGVANVFLSWFDTDWDTVWTSVKTFFSNTWNSIKTFFTNTISGIKTVATTVWNAISGFFTTVLTTIKTTFTTVWTAIKTAVVNLWNGLKTTASTVWNGVKSFFSSVLNGIKTIFSTVWNAIKTTVTTVVNAIKTHISIVWNTIKSVIST